MILACPDTSLALKFPGPSLVLSLIKESIFLIYLPMLVSQVPKSDKFPLPKGLKLSNEDAQCLPDLESYKRLIGKLLYLTLT